MAIIGNIYDVKKLHFTAYFDDVFEYLFAALTSKNEVYERLKGLPVGSFEKVDLNKSIFPLEQVFYTKDRTTCFFESHQKYIDFQLIVEGEEQMEMTHSSLLSKTNEYSPKKDLITYKFTNNASKILMKTGDIAIFFPNDAHMGLGKSHQSSLVRKTVIKYPVNLWNI